MHPAVGRATDSDEPRTRCWLGLRRIVRNARPGDAMPQYHCRTGGTASVRRSPAVRPDEPAPARRRSPPSPRTSSTSTRCSRAYHEVRPDPSDPGPAGRLRDVGPPRLGVPGRVQRGPHPRHDRGDLPLPGRRRATPARCSSAATRTRCPSPPGGPRSRCWSANGVDVRVDADDGYTPTPAVSHAILVAQPRPTARRAASPTASSSRRRTTRPTTAASSTTRPTAARPTPTSRAGSRTRRTGSSRRRARTALDGIARVPFERARAHGRRARLPGRATSTTSAASSTWTAIAASGLRIGVDPLGGAAVAYWAAIAERYGLDLTVTNADGRPDVRRS